MLTLHMAAPLFPPLVGGTRWGAWRNANAFYTAHFSVWKGFVPIEVQRKPYKPRPSPSRNLALPLLLPPPFPLPMLHIHVALQTIKCCCMRYMTFFQKR